MDNELESKIDFLAKEYAVKAVLSECLCPIEDAYNSVVAIKTFSDGGKFRQMRAGKGIVPRDSYGDIYEQEIAGALIKTKTEIKNLLLYAIKLANQGRPHGDEGE